MKPTKERPGYKKTKSGWIPEEWEIVKLGDVSKIIGGGTPSTKESSFWKNGTIYWATPTDFTKRKGNYITETDLKVTKKAIDESNINILNIGSVIMSSRATIGECKINLTQLTINQGFASFECGKSLFNIFLLYLIKFLKKEIIRKSSGSTFLEISKSSLRSFEIPLPPFLVQQKIAEILSTVDEKIEAIDAHIQENQKLKKGLMNQLLTKGIGHKEFKETEIGDIPMEWEIVLLDSVGIRGSGHTPNRRIPKYWDGGIKWVSLADTKRLDKIFISETEHEISEEGIRNSSAVKHKEGTVIISRDAGVGKSAILKCEMAVSQHFMAWECTDRLNNFFLYYLFQSWKKKFESIAAGTTIKTIGLGFFKKIKIPLPSINEQKKIADILGTVDEKIEVLREKKEAYQTLKKGLMQKLLTGEIRVNPST